MGLGLCVYKGERWAGENVCERMIEGVGREMCKIAGWGPEVGTAELLFGME